MSVQRPERRRRSVPNFRLMLEYFMALLMISGAFFFIFSERLLGYDYFAESPLMQGAMRWIIAGLFFLYGIFRLYRANLLRKEDSYTED